MRRWNKMESVPRRAKRGSIAAVGKYLIVGGAGYVGSHVVAALVAEDADVVVLDSLRTGHRESLVGGHLVEGSLEDAALFDRVFSAHRFDCVFHFAASSLVGESMEQPLAYYRNNTAGTICLLEAMRRHRVDRIVFSSSASVYGEPRRLPIDEADPTNPGSPYGRSKRQVEEILADCSTHGIRSVMLRYFNAAGAHASGRIGEDHRPETHLVPLVLQVALGQRESIRIFGTDWSTRDGSCVRDYVHVSDLASAHLLAERYLADGGSTRIYNLGSEAGLSVFEIIHLSRKISGHPIPVRESSRRAGDPSSLVASSNRIRSELGWERCYDDPEKLIRTAWEWHRHHPRGYRSGR